MTATEEAYKRAIDNDSTANYQTIQEHFQKLGLAEFEIKPRINVFTAKAWEYKGRKVINSELGNGARIRTKIPVEIDDEETGEKKKINKRSRAIVYHLTQTIGIDEKDSTPPPEEEIAEKVDKVTARYTAGGRGLNLLFPDKPNEGIRKMLHNDGWKWHRKKKYWYNKLTSETYQSAKDFVLYFGGVFENDQGDPDFNPDPDGTTGGGKKKDNQEVGANQRQPTTASIDTDKFQDMIARLRRQAAEKMNPATASQNWTPRRQRILESMQHDARQLTKAADVLESILICHNEGMEMPVEIAEINTMTAAKKFVSHANDKTIEACSAVVLADNKTEMIRRQTAEMEQEIQQREANLRASKIPGFFPTPPDVIEKMIAEADIQPNDIILEPSAGKGDIVYAAAGLCWRVDYCEINHTLTEFIEARNNKELFRVNKISSDFMDLALGTCRYDKILMNPPFEKRQDIEHIRKAYDHLKTGGTLIALCGSGSIDGSGKRESEFCRWIMENGGWWKDLPSGSFKDAFNSTGVNVKMVTIPKN